MKHIFKKALAVSLAVVMLFTVMSVTAFADVSDANAKPITLGQQQMAVISKYGEEAIFVYTPEVTGVYCFESFSDNDTVATAFNSNMQILTSDDESGLEHNFRLRINLNEGERYYFSVKYYYYENLGEIPFMLSLMDIPNIELKETTEVNITTKGQEVLFKYIPDTTETYIFKSISNNLDTRCTVYNSQFDPIAEKDDSAMDNNFYLEITLEADETYYLGVSFYKADMLAKFSVLLSKVESPFQSIEAQSGFPSPPPHGQAIRESGNRDRMVRQLHQPFCASVRLYGDCAGNPGFSGMTAISHVGSR
jgi:hypothetical protein